MSFTAGRYHSLFGIRDRIPPNLEVTAESEDVVVMALEHRTLPVAAVQFHRIRASESKAPGQGEQGGEREELRTGGLGYVR